VSFQSIIVAEKKSVGVVVDHSMDSEVFNEKLMPASTTSATKMRILMKSN
jgi:hypothetical protein